MSNDVSKEKLVDKNWKKMVRTEIERTSVKKRQIHRYRLMDSTERGQKKKDDSSLSQRCYMIIKGMKTRNRERKSFKKGKRQKERFEK